MIFGVIAGQMVESTRHECKQCAFENAVEILKCLSRLEFQTLNFTLTTPTLNSPIESSGFPYSHAEIIFFVAVCTHKTTPSSESEIVCTWSMCGWKWQFSDFVCILYYSNRDLHTGGLHGSPTEKHPENFNCGSNRTQAKAPIMGDRN